MKIKLFYSEFKTEKGLPPKHIREHSNIAQSISGASRPDISIIDLLKYLHKEGAKNTLTEGGGWLSLAFDSASPPSPFGYIEGNFARRGLVISCLV